MEAYITEKRVWLARKDVLAGTRSNEHATNFLSHVNMHDPTVDSIPAGDDGGLSKFQTTELRSRSSPGIAAPLNAPGRTFSFFSTTRAR